MSGWSRPGGRGAQLDDPTDPYVAAQHAQRRRRRWRAVWHACVLIVLIGLVGGVGVVAGGAVLGRWELPEVPFLEPEVEPSVVAAEPSAAPTPACDPPEVAGVDPGAVTVRVLNATSTEGLAAGMQAELTGRGFLVSDIGNFSGAVSDPALVRFPPDAEPQAVTVAAHVQGAVLAVDEAADVVTLTLGDGYLGVRPVQEAALLASTPVPSLLGCPVVPVVPAEPAATS